MNFFIYYILPFIFVLGILIFFHELGHFLLAKAFNVKVLKFALGFGPPLAKKQVGDTEYSIRSVPLGGFVKMLGENSEEDEKPLPAEEKKRAYNHQHVLKRMAIVGAGPVFNLLLALLIFVFFFLIGGKHIMVPEVGQVREGSPAEKAGLQKNDLIVSVGGTPVETWPEIRDTVKGKGGEPLAVTVERGGRLRTITVIPEVTTIKNIFGEDVQSALIGIVASGRFERMDLSPGKAVAEAFSETWRITVLTCQTIVKLFQRIVPIKTLGGPILIGQMTGQLAQENWMYLFPFMAVISINLFILNLLPVPVLDGGVLIFLLIELIIGKPLSIKKREMAQRVGLFLLVTLMAVVIYNDITRLLE